MKVYCVLNWMNHEDEAAFTSFERAKDWLQKSIIDYHRTRNPLAPSPCEGWSWWQRDSRYFFGPSGEKKYEGSIAELDLLDAP